MYYEIHGSGRPLVLLHGAFSAIGTSFAEVLPGLAESRQVVAFELQGHGRTADIDRPVSMEQMADDVAAALEQLDIGPADIFGYSMGAGVALHLGIRHPEAVRKLVFASVASGLDGLHPELVEALGEMTPDMMVGSPWHEEYRRITPDPDAFETLFAKKTQMDREIQDIPAGSVRALEAPTLLIVGDSDIIRPEHSVELFRLLGGGVVGDVYRSCGRAAGRGARSARVRARTRQRHLHTSAPSLSRRFPAPANPCRPICQATPRQAPAHSAPPSDEPPPLHP